MADKEKTNPAKKLTTKRKLAKSKASLKYYLKNREEILQKRKKYREENREKHNEKQREYRAQNKGMDAAACKRYRDKHRKKVISAYLKYNQKHREERKVYAREWRKRNKLKESEYREKRARWIPVIDGKKIRNYLYMTKEEALGHPKATNAIRVRKSG